MSRKSTAITLPGTQATIRHGGETIYLGTYATEPEVRLARHLAGTILGHPRPEPKPDLPPGTEARVTAKVKVRLVAHARRTGCPVHTPTLLPLDSQTGFKGVYRMPYPYRAEIRKDRRSHFLGTYRTRAEAALAYNEGARLLFGTDDLILNDIPAEELPPSERVEEIHQEVRRRLGLPTTQPELATAAADQ